ncbi:hypothetical protein HRQ65_00810 [Tatlockia micdadei]|nr:hypothetical protein B6V88_07575 [Legionella micdadei]NSL16918.1 hypothetical protein [Legionella micdadei]
MVHAANISLLSHHHRHRMIACKLDNLLDNYKLLCGIVVDRGRNSTEAQSFFLLCTAHEYSDYNFYPLFELLPLSIVGNHSDKP